MNCVGIEASELAEKYLLGRLSAGEEDAYEQHFLACQRCFEELQLHQGLQTELQKRAPVNTPRVPVRPWMTWVAAAAAVVIVAGVMWRVVRTSAATPAPIRVAAPVAKRPDFDLLARFEPPTYTTPVLRGPASPHAFAAAMRDYKRGRYAEAIPALQSAVKADPDAADPQFFLAVCYLMDRQTDRAIESFRSTIALGDSLDVEMAHFYLAKALLRKHDRDGAVRELQAAVVIHGDLEKQSRELLDQLR